MSEITFKGNKVYTNGSLLKVNSIAPDFTGVKGDLSELSLSSLNGKRVILNVFPSLDTAICAASVRRFNKEAVSLQNTVILAISKDLPFAQRRFCMTEGIDLDKVIPLSLFRDSTFEDNYGMLLTDGPLKGLLTRGVIIVDEVGKIIYTELVLEITEEPNYEAVLASLT
ncbi:MAG: thiol peroxidase [Tannerellaceae bacterium]|jgi:thiol peroxidase|nr:thiol peroxidase [Tannerellaceae bacterium]